MSGLISSTVSVVVACGYGIIPGTQWMLVKSVIDIDDLNISILLRTSEMH